jgi:2-polyprenyl-3-methyl-5-hydroxy-6-metoxy-1,4-benzoquinol methylase
MMSHDSMAPTRDGLDRIFRQKHGDLTRVGWGPRTRFRFGYFTPDEYYESVVSSLVTPGCSWIDVGGGHDLFPYNQPLATELAARCGRLVAVDPSKTIEENRFASERVNARLEDFECDELFDVATLRMVAEHIEAPEAFVAALARLVKPRGMAVVYTVNRWSPISIISSLTPFVIHHKVKSFIWNTEERDTFPVAYKMNTKERIRTLFHRAGFCERHFEYLDDCRTFHRFRALNYLELSAWRLLRTVGLHYPENCLLGVYQRNG